MLRGFSYRFWLDRAPFGGWVAVCAVLTLLGPVSQAWGQQMAGPPRSGPDRSVSQLPALEDGPAAPAAPEYDVIALRVEFQPDTTRFTTGDGTFSEALFDTLEPSIDPLPHDAAYFRAHLSFLRDYVGTVSDGKTTLRTHLVPEVVRLPHRMAHYSPTGPDAGTPEELATMAELVRDAWTEASAVSGFEAGRFDPDRTALILFHAGAGRDLELVGTTLAKTPEDLPSLYLGEAQLTRHLGTLPQFNGLPVTHSIVLPETETRVGTDPITREPFLAEFSLNGIMAASFFNFLGVPDLFDTESGESAIGPFGLMDPMGMFAYRGLFPPEPSAWTKAYLGWIDPVVRRPGENGRLALAAESSFPGASAVRVPITEGEYFLLENRHRDPGGDGLEIRVWRDGSTETVRVPRSDTTLSRFSAEGFPGGVLTGVSDYDWALPGAVAEADSLLLGGTAIWHVDERVIRERLGANRVNADSDRRGVDLEEADGAQDIGEESQGVFGTGAERGTAFDLFYRGNPARVLTEEGETIRLYRNRFGPETRPSSASNVGGPSFVVLDSFSGTAPTMEMTLRRSEHRAVAAIEGWHGRRIEGRFGPGAELLLPPSSAADRGLYVVEDTTRSDRRLLRLSAPEDGAEVSTVATGLIGRPVWQEDGWTALIDRPDGWAIRLSRGEVIPAPAAPSGPGRPVGDPLTVREPGADGPSAVAYQLVQGDGEARLVRIGRSGPEGRFGAEVTERWPGLEAVGLARRAGGGVAVIGRDRVVPVGAGERTWDRLGGPVTAPERVAFGRDRDGSVGWVADPETGALRWLRPDGARTVRVDRSFAQAVPGDFDADGFLDVLAAGPTGLRAYTQEGGLVAGFPMLEEVRPVGDPLVARSGPEERTTVLTLGSDGYLHAQQVGTERQRSGFPLPVGDVSAHAVAGRDSLLAAVDRDGSLSAWRWNRGNRFLWGHRHGNAFNQRFVGVARPDSQPDPTMPDGLIEEGRTYLWPNPLRSGRGHVRVTCRSRCRVEVQVVDLAGTAVDRFEDGFQQGGVPRDHVWEADLGSGVYYLRVRAEGEEGRADTYLLRGAIIR